MIMKKLCMSSKLMLILFLVSSSFLSCNRKKDIDHPLPPETTPVEEVVPQEPTTKYGININDYDMIEGVVRSGSTLSDLLSQHNVPHSVIHEIGLVSHKAFDVRKFRSGNSYAVFLSKDSVAAAHYLKYDIDEIDYVVYAFADSVFCYKGSKDTDTIIKKVSGEVTTSLWNAMIDAGASALLTDELSDVYAWTVDFFGIQKGDKFKAVYENIVVDDTVVVKCGRILCSEFVDSGTPKLAYYFDNGVISGYFDEKGESLRKQFLKAPLKYKRISSGFTYHRKHPIYKTVRPHLGVDYAAPSGTPVYTVGDGTVIAKGWDNKGGGNYIRIKHNSVYTTLYMHLKGFAKGVSVGSKVKQGQLIGYVGSTGASTGPHLDYRVFKNGTPINPLNMNPEPVEPIKAVYMPDFMALVEKCNALMNE